MTPNIFISYSWKNKDIADIIDNDWQAVGINLIRDIRDLNYKQDIKDFMRRVNDSDFVLLLISKGYLESSSCMYEALEMFDNPTFKTRILPILIEDARISKPIERAIYLGYWEQEIQKLTNVIKNLTDLTNAASLYEELNHFTRIRAFIDKFINEIMKILCIPWPDAKNDNYKVIFNEIGYNEEGILEECFRIQNIQNIEEQSLALDELSCALSVPGAALEIWSILARAASYSVSVSISLVISFLIGRL